MKYQFISCGKYFCVFNAMNIKVIDNIRSFFNGNIYTKRISKFLAKMQMMKEQVIDRITAITKLFIDIIRNSIKFILFKAKPHKPLKIRKKNGII